MKELFPKQKEAWDFFVSKLSEGLSTIDTSSVGTGKTVVAAAIIKTLGCPVAVICPKSVIPSWDRELKDMEVHEDNVLFIHNFELIRRGKKPFLNKRGKKIMQWDLPKDTVVLVDEIHKCKGPYTQNCQLVISLIQQGYRVHGMSATACEDPTEMRSIGYMLGLHSLNKSEGGKKSWYSWMKQNGCYQDQWKQWRLAKRACLKEVKKSIYGVTGKKLSVADFPESFRANRVFIEPIQFKDASKIVKAYDELGITPSIIQDYIENGTVTDSEFVLVNLLRARQLAESLKVQDMADIAQDLANQGNSVVLFVNFRETIEALCERLGNQICGRIEGGQTSDERQKIVDSFQSDDINLLVVNTCAGGTGLSLHDVNGKRPRISLISPSFSAKDHLQTLGRIHRNGAKSDAVQKILVAADSIEEAVMKSIDKKLKNLEALHG
jgi:SNF2 family DNA or RNA helicase